MTFAGEHVEQHVPLYRLELPARHALTTAMATAQTSSSSQGETAAAGGITNTSSSPTKSPLKKKSFSPARGEVEDKVKRSDKGEDSSLRVVCLSFNLKGQTFADHAGSASADTARAPPQVSASDDGDSYSAVGESTHININCLRTLQLCQFKKCN